MAKAFERPTRRSGAKPIIMRDRNSDAGRRLHLRRSRNSDGGRRGTPATGAAPDKIRAHSPIPPPPDFRAGIAHPLPR